MRIRVTKNCDLINIRWIGKCLDHLHILDDIDARKRPSAFWDLAAIEVAKNHTPSEVAHSWPARRSKAAYWSRWMAFIIKRCLQYFGSLEKRASRSKTTRKSIRLGGTKIGYTGMAWIWKVACREHWDMLFIFSKNIYLILIGTTAMRPWNVIWTGICRAQPSTSLMPSKSFCSYALYAPDK